MLYIYIYIHVPYNNICILGDLLSKILDSFPSSCWGGGAVEADISLEAEDVVDADEPEAADETPEAGEAA